MSKRSKKKIDNLHQNRVQILPQNQITNLPEFDAMRDRFAIARRRRRLQSLLSLVEDRRYLPNEVRQTVYHDLSGRQVSPVVSPVVHISRSSDGSQRNRVTLRDYYKFQDPERIPVCRRRFVRRSVLFALKAIGKGRSGKRRYIRPARWTGKSFIRCK